MKAYAFGLCVAVIAATALAVPSVEAQTQQRQYVNSKARNAAANRPGARVTVAPRSFLDAGTEVLPGERKFTDYALPPAISRWAWSTISADAWAGTHRRCPGPSISRAATIRSAGSFVQQAPRAVIPAGPRA